MAERGQFTIPRNGTAKAAATSGRYRAGIRLEVHAGKEANMRQVMDYLHKGPHPPHHLEWETLARPEPDLTTGGMIVKYILVFWHIDEDEREGFSERARRWVLDAALAADIAEGPGDAPGRSL